MTTHEEILTESERLRRLDLDRLRLSRDRGRFDLNFGNSLYVSVTIY